MAPAWSVLDTDRNWTILDTAEKIAKARGSCQHRGIIIIIVIIIIIIIIIIITTTIIVIIIIIVIGNL